MKDKLSCYIVDDEPLAQKILQQYVAKVPFLELKGTFSNPLEASSQMEDDQPDLLFLDINMPELDGLSFIPMLNPRPMIILTTAYDEYALKAYELEVMDYLLKPFSFERFYKSVMRLYQSRNSRLEPERKEHTKELEPQKEYLFLKVGHRTQKIAVNDILLIEGMRDYLRIYTTKEKIMVLLSFAKLEEHLSPDNFVRVHKSFMVALDKIDHIEKNRIRIAGHIVSISETYRELFFTKLKRVE